jgi:hypothetical protein
MVFQRRRLPGVRVFGEHGVSSGGVVTEKIGPGVLVARTAGFLSARRSVSGVKREIDCVMEGDEVLGVKSGLRPAIEAREPAAGPIHVVNGQSNGAPESHRKHGLGVQVVPLTSIFDQSIDVPNK